MPEISAGDNPPPVPGGGLLPLLVAGDGPGDGPFPGVVVTVELIVRLIELDVAFGTVAVAAFNGFDMNEVAAGTGNPFDAQ